MLQVKRFSGVLNTDDKNSDVLQGQHISAKNIRFTGGANGLTVENVKGNQYVINSDLPAGTNECIGAFFDGVKQRIIWFNYNSNGDNGIYAYYIQTEVVTPVFICGTDSATDILTFSLDYPVHSAAIVYRSEGDGDLIYWTDGNNPPRYLNLDTVADLAPFTETMVNAAKECPLQTLTVQYTDNAALNVNNLNKKLFRFAYRFLYANLEKSTFSPLSEVPLPVDGYVESVINDPTKNNTISISGVARLADNINVGDITGVQIIGQESLGNVWSDYFIITEIPSSDFSVGTFTYSFTNDSVYTGVPTDESDLYFSYLPDKANTLELLNGNVLVYGGLTDGYDNLLQSEVDVVMFTGLGEGSSALSVSGHIINTQEILGIVGGDTTEDTEITIRFRYDNGSIFTVEASYIALGGDIGTTVAAFVAEINVQIAALGLGSEVTATQVGVDGSTFTITTSNVAGSFPTGYLEFSNESPSGLPYENSVPKYSSQYRYGIVYFDEHGKTNGVVSFLNQSSVENNFSVNTLDFPSMSAPPANQYTPYVMASINHLPPSWAKRFQWVRTPNQTTASYLQWITNDYQEDTEYMYFCIENLTYLKTENTGFIPGYEFASGDRIRVLGEYNSGTGARTGGASYLNDYEILGTVTRTMSSPASDGIFIKVKKPTLSPGYGNNLFIELYTPLQRVNDDQQLFFEFGETFEINENDPSTPTVRYHGGNILEQMADRPATFIFYSGDSYFKPRIFYLNVDDTATKTVTMMDLNYSDYFQSKVNSNGRGWIIDENAATQYNNVLVRWGGKYQSGTNINQLSTFRPLDYDEVDRSKGDIRRFKVRDRIMRVFQDRGVGQYGIYSKFIQNNDGNNTLVTTNEIITSNNIQYYQGVFGLCGYPTNLSSTVNADYFIDVVTGRAIRLSGDGLTDLGLIYKGQYYLSRLATPYNKELTRTNGSVAKILGFYDTYDNDAHFILQAGSSGSTTVSDNHFSFNESRNGFNSFYDYHPEWAICANDVVFTWKEGGLWSHDSDTYCNFYGTQYGAEIGVVFNDNLLQKKSWNAISELASGTWVCPLIYSNTNTYGTQRQETNLVEAEFLVLEGMPSAAIKRDVKSPGGKWNGDFMKGNWLAVTFSKENAQNLITLGELSMRATDSPRTDR